MCKALTDDGFPSREVRVLGPTAPSPVTSAVVIVTQAVRDQFGTSLTYDYAPAILATFGSADASVTVQVIDAQGAAGVPEGAWRRPERAEIRRNRPGGCSQPHDVGRGQAAAAGRRARLAATGGARPPWLSKQSIDILDFGNIPTGCRQHHPAPLCGSGRERSGRSSDRFGLRAGPAGRSGLDARSLYRPTRIVTVTVDGQAALRVEFAAPSPLGLFGPQYIFLTAASPSRDRRISQCLPRLMAR